MAFRASKCHHFSEVPVLKRSRHPVRFRDFQVAALSATPNGVQQYRQDGRTHLTRPGLLVYSKAKFHNLSALREVSDTPTSRSKQHHLETLETVLHLRSKALKGPFFQLMKVVLKASARFQPIPRIVANLCPIHPGRQIRMEGKISPKAALPDRARESSSPIQSFLEVYREQIAHHNALIYCCQIAACGFSLLRVRLSYLSCIAFPPERA